MSVSSFDEFRKILGIKMLDLSDASIITNAYALVAEKARSDSMGYKEEFKSVTAVKTILVKMINKHTLDEKELGLTGKLLSASSPAVRKMMIQNIKEALSKTDWAHVVLSMRNHAREILPQYRLNTPHITQFSIPSAPTAFPGYAGLKGDALKSAILANFQKSIADVKDKGELYRVISNFRNSDEFKILARGQGAVHRLFALTKHSIQAFETICDEAERKFKDEPGIKI